MDTTSTTYTVRLSDAVPNGGINGNFDITLSVSGPNGTATKIIKGYLKAPVSGYPSSIQLVSINPATISVKATGETETSVITFQVKDSYGNPINSSRADSTALLLRWRRYRRRGIPQSSICIYGLDRQSYDRGEFRNCFGSAAGRRFVWHHKICSRSVSNPERAG